jgi:hypothetical protein
MPGAKSHPQPCVQSKKAHKQSHHRYAEAGRHSLRNGFTAYSTLSPAIGPFVTVTCEIASHRLDISVEISGPRGFAVRIVCTRLSHRSVHRIPRPTSVTIAKRPSCGRETSRILPVILARDQLRHVGTTGKSLCDRKTMSSEEQLRAYLGHPGA